MILWAVLGGILIGLAIYACLAKFDLLLDPGANWALITLVLGAVPLLALLTGQFPQALWHLAILVSVAVACWFVPPHPVFGTAIVILLYANGMHFFDRIDALTLAQSHLILWWRLVATTLSGALFVSAWKGGHLN